MGDGGFKRQEENGIPYYACIAFQEFPFLRHGFSTRHGGVSPLPLTALNLSQVSWDSPTNVAENRRRFLAALRLEHVPLVTLSQVHSSRLHILDENTPPENGRPQADAVATMRSGTAIGVQVADCFPILVADPRKRVIAAIHAGWRGTLERIFSKTVAGLRAGFGTDPADLITAVGPGIHPCCFEVGPEVVDQFRAAYPGVKLAGPHPARHGKYFIDLPKALQLQFEETGLNVDNVFILNACTRCNTGEFFSYRGEGPQSGRMMAVIAIGTGETPPC
jgi:polyphenol oxidase